MMLRTSGKRAAEDTESCPEGIPLLARPPSHPVQFNPLQNASSLMRAAKVLQTGIALIQKRPEAVEKQRFPGACQLGVIIPTRQDLPDSA